LTEVSGTIQIKGQPPKMKGLEILFMGADGRIVAAPIAEDGTYSTKEVRAGDVKVGFAHVSAQQGSAEKGRRIKPPAGKDAEPKGPPETRNPIPIKLRDPETSELTTKLIAGQANEFKYDIKEFAHEAPVVK
jgi:hypothetical protein